MATNIEHLPVRTRRVTDRSLYIGAAVAFPLLVLAGYFKTYYFKAFFADAPPLANSLVHFHGLVMSLWVVYFTVQIALVRVRKVKLHMTMGMIGVALAALVIIVGMATAYDSQLIRNSAPPGIDPRTFFVLPAGDMLLFAVFFIGAVYFRKRPAEHKSLMLMTAINFAPAAIFRLPIMPAEPLMYAFGSMTLVSLAALGYHTWKHKKLNAVFASAVALFIVSLPVRLVVAETETWLRLMDWLAGK